MPMFPGALVSPAIASPPVQHGDRSRALEASVAIRDSNLLLVHVYEAVHPEQHRRKEERTEKSAESAASFMLRALVAKKKYAGHLPFTKMRQQAVIESPAVSSCAPDDKLTGFRLVAAGLCLLFLGIL